MASAVTPGAVAPPLSPSNAGTHGRAYTDGTATVPSSVSQVSGHVVVVDGAVLVGLVVGDRHPAGRRGRPGLHALDRRPSRCRRWPRRRRRRRSSSPPPPATTTAPMTSEQDHDHGQRPVAAKLVGAAARRRLRRTLVASVGPLPSIGGDGAAAPALVPLPLRWMTASLPPRYDATTCGWASTSAGGPAVTTRPWSSATSRSDTAVTSGMSCSMTTTLAPELGRGCARITGAERLGLALGDAARRLVEQDHRRPVRHQARQVDDAPRAGRQLAHELASGTRPRPSSSISSSTRCVHRLLGVERGRQVQRGLDRVAHLDPALERHRDALLDGQGREQAGVLERPAEARPGPAVGGAAR